MRRATHFALSLGCLLILSACTLKATLNQTTDTTSNITGTTSGRTWFTEDGLLTPEHKAIAFVTLNYDNVQQDVARGQGEYLASLGTLLGVSEHEQAIFQAKAQQRFAVLAGTGRSTPATIVSGLVR